MKTIDISIKNEYYSQVNNKFIPQSACTPTSMAMALIYEGIQIAEAGSTSRFSTPFIAVPKGIALDDYLTAVIRSEIGLHLRETLAPWAVKDDIEVQTIHAVVSEVVNMLVGRSVTKFKTNTSLHHLEAEIRAGHPCVISGYFTGAGHTVVVAGMKWDNNDNITDVILDDPYGSYLDGYKTRSGNNVSMPVAMFTELWKGYYHQFRKNGYV